VEKATELGASSIQPLATERTTVRLAPDRALRRLEHWQAVAVAACEQCGRNRVPDVREMVALDTWLRTRDVAATGIVLAPGTGRSLAQLPPPTALDILIGPEGGLTADEVAGAARAGLAPVHLGPRVLRVPYVNGVLVTDRKQMSDDALGGRLRSRGFESHAHGDFRSVARLRRSSTERPCSQCKHRR